MYDIVVATLAMIESPYDHIYLSVDSTSQNDKSAESKDSPLEPEMIMIKRPMVTSSLRASRRLLITRSGYRAILACFAFSFGYNQLNKVVTVVIGHSWIGEYTAFFLATMLVSPLMLMWTHLVITPSSPGRWSRLRPTRAMIKKVAPATAMWALTVNVSTILPLVVRSFSAGLKDDFSDKMVLGTVDIASWLLMVPATVTLTRVQASLLAESEETIVPFDRTFNGAVVLESDGGDGKLRLKDGWRTFGLSSRLRLLGLVVKSSGLQLGILLTYVLVFALELRLIGGASGFANIIQAINDTYKGIN